jgi:hypothetical protein
MFVTIPLAKVIENHALNLATAVTASRIGSMSKNVKKVSVRESTELRITELNR